MFRIIPKPLCAGLIACLFLIQCSDPEILGIDQVGQMGLAVRVSDTSHVEAWSVIDTDSMRTDERAYAVLGYLHDEVMGATQAWLYTQVNLPTGGFKPVDGALLDSVVLTLEIKDYYGDTLKELRFNVYELSADISYAQDYYSSSVLSHYLTKASSATVRIQPKTKRLLNQSVSVPHIRLRLNDYFKNKLSQADTSFFENTTAFLSMFKGFCIQVEAIAEGGVLASIDLMSGNTMLQAWYHTAEDTFSVDFPVNETSARFSRFVHDHSAGDPAFFNQVISGDKTLGDSILYVQPLKGVNTIIRFPYLSAWDHHQTGQVVNTVDLVINVNEDQNQRGGTLAIPEALELGLRRPDNYADSLTAGIFLSSMSSVFNAAKNEYRFQLTFEILDQLDKADAEFEWVLRSANRSFSMPRLVLFDPLHKKTNNIKLEITYTPIN